MDQQRIKACIDAMTASDLAEMEFSQDGWSLRLVRRPDRATALPAGTTAAPVAAAAAAGAPAGAAAPAPAATPASVAAPPAAEAVPPLCAPLYGVVHLAPAPGEAAFVEVGRTVTAGQTVCVIEAMKVFNEVRAECDATVAEILVESGQEVETGRPLLRFA